MLMSSGKQNKSLKVQVSSIVKQVNEVVKKHQKYPLMKQVMNQVTNLMKLVNTFENLNPDKNVRLRQMKGYLTELKTAVYKYVEDSFVDEAYPDWYRSDPSQENKQRLLLWRAQKMTRIIAAHHKAINEYRSVQVLREAIENLELDILYARKGKSTKKHLSDTPSSSNDAGNSVVELDEESGDEDQDSSAAQPMQAEEEVDTGAITEKAKELLQGALMYVINDSLVIEEALMAVIRIAESGGFNEVDWKKLVQGLLNAARQGTHSDDAIGYRHVNSIKAVREFLRNAGKQLSSLNLQATEWWKDNKYEVPEKVIEGLINEADRLQVTELQRLKDTGALDDVNRALESVRIIAASAAHRMHAWENLAQALQTLYGIYNNQSLQRPLAVGRLIGFLERAANILRMKHKESSLWFDQNVSRFVNPESASGQRPMEIGKGLEESDIPEEIYVDDFEDDDDD